MNEKYIHENVTTLVMDGRFNKPFYMSPSTFYKIAHNAASASKLLCSTNSVIYVFKTP